MAKESLPGIARDPYLPQERLGVSQDGRPTMPGLIGDPKYMRARPSEAEMRDPMIGADGIRRTRYVKTDRSVDEQLLNQYRQEHFTVEDFGWYAEVSISQADFEAKERAAHDKARGLQRSVSGGSVAGAKPLPAETAEVSSKDLL